MAKTAVATQSQNPLKKLENEIINAKDMKSLMQVDVISNRYIKNFEASTGRKDGAEVFEREAFAFIDLANSKPELMKADKMSIFAGIIKAGHTGLSFASGKLSVYVRGGRLVVDPDAHGKREMMERMPEIKKLDEAVLVFEGDDFKYSAIDKQVKSHDQVWPRPKASEKNVTGAYCSVHFNDGHREDIIMDIEEILIAKSKAQTQNIWNTHFAEMVKKTVYNRAYKVLYKTPNTVVLYGQFEGKAVDVDHDEVQERPSNVDEDGVVTEAEVVKEEGDDLFD